MNGKTPRGATATLADIANVAGVSKATVSRALSNPDRLNSHTVARIKKIADDLNYVSHGIARALATSRTRLVGAVIPTLNNAIYAVSTHSLEQRLRQDGYLLLVASHDFDLGSEVDAVKSLAAHGVDAVVLVGLTHARATFALLDRIGIPYVLTWNSKPGAKRPCVGFDNQEAGRLVARHLLALGHRHIGVLSGIMTHNDRATARVHGVREACAQEGAPIPGGYIVSQPYTLEGGRRGLRILMKKDPAPTAIICGNDILAIGASYEAKARHIALPAQLSITGFDDMPIAAVLDPPLTTVHFPMAEVGVNAAIHVLNELGASDEKPNYHLPMKLVVRGSTARAQY